MVQNPYTQILKELVLIRNIPWAIKVFHNEFIAMMQWSDIFSFVLQLSRSEQYFCFAITPATSTLCNMVQGLCFQV